MKIYTEEQVEKAFRAGMSACMKHQDWALSINYPNKIELSEYMQSVTPIELPTDEEIENVVKKFKLITYRNGFRECARWMRDKIQGGNK